MSKTLDANIYKEANIYLPEPAADAPEEILDIYARFMRHLEHVPNSRLSIKVLSALQFTADMKGYSDAHMAKTLVDNGLRAPRMAFPAEFLDFADQALLRSGWEVGGPNKALLELRAYWDVIGEDKFCAARKTFSLLEESTAVH